MDSVETAPGVLHYRVRVLDGRNGMPLANAHVKLWYDERGGDGFAVVTDSHGVANMPAPLNHPIRVLALMADLTDCRKPGYGDPSHGYNLGAIAKGGIAAENRCGLVEMRPQRGELVLFARAPRWYEGINRGSGN